MSEQLYIQIIINYVESAKALRENTAAVTSFNGSIQTSDFESLWQERELIFHRWQNAAASLRELPDEYVAQAVAEIEKI
ncbi:MAG TPA: hypothetical protein DEF35_08790 [Paenibacillus sp.]|uniref:hypothetical protein n=1 Tax=Paenibacillus TaxID=44249 RepID=UPI000BA0A2D9|nr:MULTISPECIES: hypothetical protein [Paenibacillus]OZQ64329.1 hypothetical protein CA599_22460 [Paenibacillus taichungensis]HBU81721.1 hypothetical protein [Paenibacillus sp.]